MFLGAEMRARRLQIYLRRLFDMGVAHVIKAREGCLNS